jgi:hypothetical protein
VAACKTFLLDNDGKMIRLQQHGERLIVFSLGEVQYRFDPNRIFTAAGRRETLEKFSSSYNRNALKELTRFSNIILKKIKKARLVVALHNNTNGEPLSIKTYINQKAYRIYVNNDLDEDDFFLTTEKKIFDYLKAQKMNVALELPGRTKDDGSLSVYCNKVNLPYVNVEAQVGHENEQFRMLQVLRGVTRKYK